MYILLTLLTGVILAVMISVNGNLSLQYGVFPSAVIIHIVGFLFAFSVCAVRKEIRKIFRQGPFWIYLGGAIGVFTTVSNNFSFGKISVTSIIALELLGQTATALLIDYFGLFGMEKRPLRKTSLVGLAFSIAGIAVMIDGTVASAIPAVFISFAGGISIVTARTVNARLAEKIGALQGSMVNHLVGLPVTVALMLSVWAGQGITAPSGNLQRIWIYMGGMLGVLVVMLYNITVPHLSAYRLTVLSFTGQVFTGIALDLIAGAGHPDASFTGGLFIAAGILINMILEKKVSEKHAGA